MQAFSAEQIDATNERLRSVRPLRVNTIDFTNPFYMQPRSQGVDADDHARLLNFLAGQPVEHVYVHVPFCAVHCLYCHYPKLTNEHSDDNQRRFVEQVAAEIDFFKTRIDLRRVRTVHLGGGTPNCLAINYLEQLLDVLGRTFRASEEFAIELYPSTEDSLTDKLTLLAERGVKRVSIGVQTFKDAVNERNRRLFQSKERVLEVVACATKMFPNVSIDLLYGQREQDLQILRDDCHIAAGLGVNSIFLYQTREWLNKHSTELQVALSEFLQFMKGAGYEIISFDQAIRRRNDDGFCVQRSARSKCEDLIGFGPGAVSEVGDYMFRNVNPTEYLRNGHGIDRSGITERSSQTRKAEYINRRLRHFNEPRIDGFSVKHYRETFGSDPSSDFPAELELLTQEGLLECDSESIRVTDYGMLFSQGINYLLLGHYK